YHGPARSDDANPEQWSPVSEQGTFGGLVVGTFRPKPSASYWRTGTPATTKRAAGPGQAATKAAECSIPATKSGMGHYSRVLLETVLSPQSIVAGEEG